MNVKLTKILCQIQFYAKDEVNDFIWVPVNQNTHQ